MFVDKDMKITNLTCENPIKSSYRIRETSMIQIMCDEEGQRFYVYNIFHKGEIYNNGDLLLSRHDPDIDLHEIIDLDKLTNIVEKGA